jgi:hypothetical protein
LSFRQKEAEAMASDFRNFLERASRRRSVASMATKRPVVEVAGKVTARYETDAQAFDDGSTSELEILDSGNAGDFACRVRCQKAKVRMKGKRIRSR